MANYKSISLLMRVAGIEGKSVHDVATDAIQSGMTLKKFGKTILIDEDDFFRLSESITKIEDMPKNDDDSKLEQFLIAHASGATRGEIKKQLGIQPYKLEKMMDYLPIIPTKTITGGRPKTIYRWAK